MNTVNLATVNMVDPNNLKGSLGPNNATPQYENMHIFAELTAQGRDRSVVTTGQFDRVTNLVTTNGSKTKVNFMGANADNNFTTNWYFGSTPSNISNREAFGISSIKTEINASFIPQISIKFVDIRGLSFFNNQDSPYRILFDFPPPIFNLTIKGFYGKALTYQIHLVKYTSEFESDSGNFVIDAEFVAMTYAPLTDVLFQYSMKFRLLDLNATVDANRATAPLNTISLIKRVEMLNSALPNTVSASTKKVDALTKKAQQINNAISLLNEYKDETISYFKSTGRAYLYINNDPSILNVPGSTVGLGGLYNYVNSTDIKFSILQDINQYKSGLLVNNKTRLYIGFEVGLGSNLEITNDPSNPNDYRYKWYNALSGFSSYLNGKLSQTYGVTIQQPIYVTAPSINFKNVYQAYYIVIDITDMYNKLIAAQNTTNNDLIDAKKSLRTLINSTTQSMLGMIPTIYNVFKILMDDVDFFFTTMRKCANSAQGNYKKTGVKNIILGSSNEDKNKDIYPFPLIYDGAKKIRTSPIALNKTLPNDSKLPELQLVYDFIETYKKLKDYEKTLLGKTSINSNGNNLWIPFTSADTVLNPSVTSPAPYSDTDINNIFSILLRRFYVLSQSSVNASIASSNTYMKYFGEAEAVNIINFVTNTNNIDKLTAFFNGNNISTGDDLIVYLTKTNPNYDKEFPSLYNNSTLQPINLGGYYAFLERDVETSPITGNFIGFDIYFNKINERIAGSDSSTDPIDNLLNELKGIFTNNHFPVPVKFTSQNLLFFDDDKDSTETNSKFFFRLDNLNYANPTIDLDPQIVYSDFNNQWIYSLTYYGYNLSQNNLIYLNNNLLVTVLLSFFGRTRSMFDGKMNNIFTNSSVIQVPVFFIYYIGALLSLSDSDKKIIIDFLNNNTKYGSKSISEDIDNCYKYLSITDKNTFINQYTDFMNLRGINLILEVKALIGGATEIKDEDTLKTYYKDNIPFNNNIGELSTRVYLIIYNSIAFKMADKNNDLQTYGPYASISASKTSFFTGFVGKMRSLLPQAKDAKKKEDEKYENYVNSENIVSETYYSFKNINDRWISGLNFTAEGYPFNEPGKSLIDMFAFVDRSMNPIGNTVLDISCLKDLQNNMDASIFTVISTLLSTNGFEFFPIQNFMTITDDEWAKECFGVSIGNIKNTSPAFVCMYIGGTSNYLTNSDNYGSGGNDGGDGILDLTKNIYNDTNLDNNIQANSSFGGWNKIKAFKVKFGPQNQSMFTSIKIDSKEYPETNESLQILAKIAGDNTVPAPVPVGQNLFNLYENRAYKITVNGLGNAMIQPTQYFQLESVPMYNGAYIILGVEHNIAENFMTTQFNGVKILKYPIPRILDPYALFGYTGDVLSNSDLNAGLSVSPANVPLTNYIKHNSMYSYKINPKTTEISDMGKNFIRDKCAQNASSGKLFTYKYADINPTPLYPNDPNPISTITAIPYYYRDGIATHIPITNAKEAADALIYLYTKYSVKYNLDPNIIAAQGAWESVFYRFAAFNVSDGYLNAVGISQIVRSTLQDLINNVYNISPIITSDERQLILNGLKTPLRINNADKTHKNNQQTSLHDDTDNILILQNAINNPELMIKTQCMYMRYLADQCGYLLSSTLAAYYRPASKSTNYNTTISKIISKNVDPKNAEEYVYNIFTILDNNFFRDKSILAMTKPFDPSKTNLA
jgi:hypothetical protein